MKSSGHVSVLSCKYHGWTYNLNGNLVKAPRFTPDSVTGFDTSSISLFSIHTHVDRNGFVYVNLDANEQPEVSWEEQYGDMDQQKVLLESGIDWTKVEYDFTWTAEGQFNWKLMQDNYNEVWIFGKLPLLVLTFALVLSLPHGASGCSKDNQSRYVSYFPPQFAFTCTH